MSIIVKPAHDPKYSLLSPYSLDLTDPPRCTFSLTPSHRARLNRQPITQNYAYSDLTPHGLGSQIQRRDSLPSDLHTRTPSLPTQVPKDLEAFGYLYMSSPRYLSWFIHADYLLTSLQTLEKFSRISDIIRDFRCGSIKQCDIERLKKMGKSIDRPLQLRLYGPCQLSWAWHNHNHVHQSKMLLYCTVGIPKHNRFAIAYEQGISEGLFLSFSFTTMYSCTLPVNVKRLLIFLAYGSHTHNATFTCSSPFPTQRKIHDLLYYRCLIIVG